MSASMPCLDPVKSQSRLYCLFAMLPWLRYHTVRHVDTECINYMFKSLKTRRVAEIIKGERGETFVHIAMKYFLEMM